DDITIRNDLATVLGPIDAAGDLTVRAGGGVTQVDAVSVAGDLDVTAQSVSGPTDYFDIVLGTTGNFWLGGSLSLSGEDIYFQEASGTPVEIGAVTAQVDSAPDGTNPNFTDGSFGLRSNGATDGSAGTISVDGRLIIDGEGDFIFDNDNAHSV